METEKAKKIIARYHERRAKRAERIQRLADIAKQKKIVSKREQALIEKQLGVERHSSGRKVRWDKGIGKKDPKDLYCVPHVFWTTLEQSEEFKKISKKLKTTQQALFRFFIAEARKKLEDNGIGLDD